MNIGIDARFLTHPQRGGFKTYTENLIAALAESDIENNYILYLDRAPNSRAKLPSRPNFSYRVVPGLLPVFGMPWREQVNLTRQVIKDQLDVLHCPSLTAPLLVKVPLVVTLHDTIWHSPNRFANGNRRSFHRYVLDHYYRIVPERAARHARVVLTDSQAAKQDIVKILGLAEERVVVTHLAASNVFKRIEDAGRIEQVRLEYHLPREYILAIGAADPRKNISKLVQAYALLSPALRERYPLVVVWAHQYLAERLQAQITGLGIQNQVLSREWASLEEMALLYNAASLFVFPSLYEGFGMPPLEAMACGTPVVAANNSSIPEIVGDAALLAEAQDTIAIANAMTRMLTNPTLRATLIERGLKQAHRFSWDQCARQTIAAYRQALSYNGDTVWPHAPSK